ncbi:PDZ domain-containing RING finger protein 4-like [Conger conger]|uniref:PDZ domain-containing RING finger protein 4-like n=1 Tax=Conger conger TaxID=82655 RepID=UPI002A59F175|nr:PDZ domain-containing RING finger protein 4-like [Conger conger]
MDAQVNESRGGFCQKGCGLALRRQAQGEHSCINALRAQNRVLQVKTTKLEQEAEKQRLQFGVRERLLLARVSSLRNEARLKALSYQNRLRHFVVHINNITKQLVTGCHTGGHDQPTSSFAVGREDSPWVGSGGRTLCQVNGKATPEEAREPMVAQVLRRSSAPGGHGNPEDGRLADVCTQTDITFEHIMALAKLRPCTPPLPDLCPFLLSDSCHSLQTVEQEFYEGTEYLPHTPASGERADEFEYEEVELCRLNSQEKLGLTLCYRTDEEDDAGIYVSEVGPNSIAARDGRVREGDRILQINGQDVRNREEAVTALCIEDFRNILLLVARPEIQLEDGWLDEEHHRLLEDLKMEMLEERGTEEVRHTSSREEQPRGCEEEEEDEVTTDAATCSSNTPDQAGDPGLSSGTPERESPSPVPTRPTQRGRASGEERGRGGRKCFRQSLEVQSLEVQSLEVQSLEVGDLSCSGRRRAECSLAEQEGVQRELRLLNEELRSIERECRSIMQARRLRGSDRDSSSAYNTAESSRSTPTGARRSVESSPRAAASAAKRGSPCRRVAGQSPAVAKPGKSGPDAPQPAPSPSPTPPPGRHANIPAHARHYQSYMHLVQQRTGVEAGQSQLSLLSACREERRARPRPDARRPARDRLLRERALKIREERSVTTDEDAASELKLGRYWSKEERKQHLLRAREQRRRREFMMRSRLESLRESAQSGGEGRKEVSILELSHRKMMKKRNRKILDNWMTIQELMSHGARTPEDPDLHSAFLSVTTV